MATVYNDQFYQQRFANTRYSAERILRQLFEGLPAARSAVDLGCGVGAWLAVAQELGIQRVLGLDGPWVRTELLAIPPECFLAYDFTQEYHPSERFDVAFSLEVAEHLPPACAATFVASLVNLADVVLFSAAIPGQGGEHHVNEQWPDYWAQLFRKHDYLACDVIRPRVWEDDGIHPCYRQNTLVYVRQAAAERYPLLLASRVDFPRAYVHPAIFSRKIETQKGVRGSMRLFRQACARWVRERVVRHPK